LKLVLSPALQQLQTHPKHPDALQLLSKEQALSLVSGFCPGVRPLLSLEEATTVLQDALMLEQTGTAPASWSSAVLGAVFSPQLQFVAGLKLAVSGIKDPPQGWWGGMRLAAQLTQLVADSARTHRSLRTFFWSAVGLLREKLGQGMVVYKNSSASAEQALQEYVLGTVHAGLLLVAIHNLLLPPGTSQGLLLGQGAAATGSELVTARTAAAGAAGADTGSMVQTLAPVTETGKCRAVATRSQALHGHHAVQSKQQAAEDAQALLQQQSQSLAPLPYKPVSVQAEADAVVALSRAVSSVVGNTNNAVPVKQLLLLCSFPQQPQEPTQVQLLSKGLTLPLVSGFCPGLARLLALEEAATPLHDCIFSQDPYGSEKGWLRQLLADVPDTQLLDTAGFKYAIADVRVGNWGSSAGNSKLRSQLRELAADTGNCGSLRRFFWSAHQLLQQWAEQGVGVSRTCKGRADQMLQQHVWGMAHVGRLLIRIYNMLLPPALERQGAVLIEQGGVSPAAAAFRAASLGSSRTATSAAPTSTRYAGTGHLSLAPAATMPDSTAAAAVGGTFTQSATAAAGVSGLANHSEAGTAAAAAAITAVNSLTQQDSTAEPCLPAAGAVENFADGVMSEAQTQQHTTHPAALAAIGGSAGSCGGPDESSAGTLSVDDGMTGIQHGAHRQLSRLQPTQCEQQQQQYHPLTAVPADANQAATAALDAAADALRSAVSELALPRAQQQPDLEQQASQQEPELVQLISAETSIALVTGFCPGLSKLLGLNAAAMPLQDVELEEVSGASRVGKGWQHGLLKDVPNSQLQSTAGFKCAISGVKVGSFGGLKLKYQLQLAGDAASTHMSLRTLFWEALKLLQQCAQQGVVAPQTSSAWAARVLREYVLGMAHVARLLVGMHNMLLPSVPSAVEAVLPVVQVHRQSVGPAPTATATAGEGDTAAVRTVLAVTGSTTAGGACGHRVNHSRRCLRSQGQPQQEVLAVTGSTTAGGAPHACTGPFIQTHVCHTPAAITAVGGSSAAALTEPAASGVTAATTADKGATAATHAGHATTGPGAVSDTARASTKVLRQQPVCPTPAPTTAVQGSTVNKQAKPAGTKATAAAVTDAARAGTGVFFKAFHAQSQQQ
jgi:hypothetical protein